MISAKQADSIRAREQAFRAAWDAFDPRRAAKGGGYTSAEIAKIEHIAGTKQPTNEERGALEQYDFYHEAPDKYFLYVNDATSAATAWPGTFLGRVQRGRSYRSPSFGNPSTRVPITVYAINGWVYSGTYFESAGSYARVKRTKKKHRMTFHEFRANPSRGRC